MAKIIVSDLPDMSLELPAGVYTVQVLSIDQKPSKKFAPMDKLELQIIAPDVVSHAGANVQAAGRKFDTYISYNLKALKMSIAGLTKLGVPTPEEVDVPDETEVQTGARTTIPEIQDFTKSLVGTRFEIQLRSEPIYETDNNRFDGNKVLVDGQPVIKGYSIRGDLSGVKSKALTPAGGSPF